MICNVCGSEVNIDNFDVCPYCLTPIKQNLNREINYDNKQNESMVVDGEECNSNFAIGTTKEEIYELDDEYEITTEDLIEDSNEAKKEILIDEIGLSVRAVNAFRRVHIYTLNELVEFLAVNNVADLKNVGAKTVQETEELMRRIQTEGLSSVIIKTDTDEAIPDRPLFETISSDTDYLSIDALLELGLSHKVVTYLNKNNIRCCGGLRYLSRNELSNILGQRYMNKLPDVASLLKRDIISLLNYILEKYRGSREYNVFLHRAKGETLQEIANNPDKQGEGVISRERVRQIERSFYKSVFPFVRELFYILKGANNFVSAQDLLDIFDDDEYDQILLYACKGSSEFEFLDFADIFIEKKGDYSVENKVLDIIKEIVDNGMDIFENREFLEGALIENKLDYISIDSIISLLKKNNYQVYGGFVVKGRSNYATICMYVIKKYFSDGIKLSQNDSEHLEDLIRLRNIINEKYQGVILPSSDRALSSTLVRSGLILRGRGQYISQEYIAVDETLMTEIKNYIDAKETNKVFYNEIYTDYEGILNVLCGVDNYNYLHGILALRYPDAYEYSRDYLIKKGVVESQADSIPDRIYSFICNMGRPISKTELVQEFRGFSNIMLITPFVNDSRLMQWDYNFYTCSGIMNIDDQDIIDLRKYIHDLFVENKGYASDALLFDKVTEYRPDFIQKNQIQSEMNLHYIVAKLFAEEMEFRRPHIGEKGKIDLSLTKNVALYLLDNPDYFTYQQYIEMVDKMKWSRVTASAVLSDTEEDYARISIDKYVKKSIFDIPEEVVSGIRDIMKSKFEDGIMPLINIDMDDFPAWEYSWNEFIIETIIRKCFNELEVIQPSMKDRRYQRGIVVKKEMRLESYSQVVATKMMSFGSDKMTESQFLSFLVIHNLARKVIPSELLNSDYVKKVGDYYNVIL